MISVKNSVSESPNLNIVWGGGGGGDTPDPPTRLVPSFYSFCVTMVTNFKSLIKIAKSVQIAKFDYVRSRKST